MDSAALLVSCELCGCFIPCSTLRSSSYTSLDWSGTERRLVRTVCTDAAACFGRTHDPRRWAHLNGSAPAYREPDPGAPLGRCQLCDIAATLNDLDVSRCHDPEDGVWFTSMTCADQDGCEGRQHAYGHIPPEMPAE